MNAKQARALLRRYLQDECTPAEKKLVETWYARLEETGNTTIKDIEEQEAWQAVMEKRMQAIIDGEEKESPVHRISTVRRITKWVAAAVLVGLVGTGIYFMFFDSKKKEEVAIVQKPVEDIKAPLTANAVITLADGRRLILDSAGNGTMAEEGDMQIIKQADGQIAYSGTAQAGADIVYNTINVPRGSRVVSLSLVDGSKAWLNSGSSLHYPVAFTGTERRVQTSGEVYFEVAKDPHKKFIVEAGDITTEVLGTHFNVNTYDDEPEPKITLLEGSVNVSQGTQSHRLKPGQQATLAADGRLQTASRVDLEEVMAWKNGSFYFRDADIRTLMRQLSRWYNAEVSYEGTIPKASFSGEIGRSLSFAQVMKILARTRVHYRIEDNNHVTILP